MWIAETSDGNRIAATRDLEPGAYQCPMCQSPVVLKRGQKVAAHFAHAPDSSCPASEAESWRHLMAKQVLVEELTAIGWKARPEIVHLAHGRRVDVGLKAPDEQGVMRYIAIEIQDSAIQVDTMKDRIARDRRIGYHATVWLFTSHRAAALLAAQPEHEVRVPDEMVWVANRYGQGVQIIDPQAREMWVATLGAIRRPGESREWYTPDGDLTGVDYPGRRLRKTKHVALCRGGFVLALAPGKFGDRYSIVFTDA
ncbi:competence protein CoiA [Streptomyces sp. ME19-01-6]|uniref:competence protein CoiA n=1 Tax=Streptomyces sp. ME19-01-6 TaxID=3028686 RepID=UPI0029BD1B41|nr:competence protein CoiA family protein [Streptomyces sp. ME19-01-6]MDX3229409.1 competence protein CoiA family protein [Streptomyces sp. ME19-01-6]